MKRRQIRRSRGCVKDGTEFKTFMLGEGFESLSDECRGDRLPVSFQENEMTMQLQSRAFKQVGLIIDDRVRKRSRPASDGGFV
jgi:hypothetical protein